ncbi:MAG: hypothetical protein CMN78_06125 [Spirochaetales bacterium]|nr:hypothetical protein [Spirochaetales bacterium]
MASFQAFAYDTRYAEQYYRLYHQHFYQHPENINENIWYLERALASDFVNPQNALARIQSDLEWERYRYLFSMHMNLELVKQYRLLGSKFDKRTAFFYNAPWKTQNLKSLEIARSYYQAALFYWENAVLWSDKAWELQFIDLHQIHHWADENYRIEYYELDYESIIAMDLERLNSVQDDFQRMDENTY